MPRDSKAWDLSDNEPAKPRSVERMVSLLREWHAEWEEWKTERDSKPLNHAHRKIWEGMCNTQMARIADLQKLIKELAG